MNFKAIITESRVGSPTHRQNFKAIITAGGSSSRFGNTNKLLEKIHSKEVIRHTVDAFLGVNEISEIIICANSSIIDELKRIFPDISNGLYINTTLTPSPQPTSRESILNRFSRQSPLKGEGALDVNIPKIRIIEGGKTRQQSVFNGLKAITDCDYVLIHDGARPMITPEIIKKAINAVQTQKSLTVATKTTDTIKQVDENLKIIKTIDRSALYNTQTPQAFEYNLIKTVHEKLAEQSVTDGGASKDAPYMQDFTDDAGMLEYLGYDVYILEGDYKNIKITTKDDIEIAKAYLGM